MRELGDDTSDIKTYSGTISGSDFGSPINTYDPSHDLDQPWVLTGSGGQVYVAYNDFSLTPTAHVLVSSDGGVNYTSAALDRNSGSIIQDAPAVRLAVNGATVYGAFTRWNSVLDYNGPTVSSSTEVRYNADLYIVRSDDGGTDGFAALGSGGLGVNVASPTGWYANTSDESLTLGQNRTGAGTELAIAVDPTNAGHVVIAYGTAPGTSGTIDAGELGLVVTESFDSGMSWTEKFATPVTSGGIKSSMPAVAIAADGMIAMLYCSYDPSTDELSQHLLTTNDDFVSTSDITLATELNTAAPFDVNPYLGDFYNLISVGNTFFGIFSAANADNGTDASFYSSTTFQRDFTGSAGTANFQLTANGNPVSASIDPFFFSFTAAITVSSGTTTVSSSTNESYIVVDSGTLEIASGGTVSGEIIVSSGGSVLVDSGGTVLDTRISSGGLLHVSSGGLADPTTIFSGGSEIVSAGGTDNGAQISGGEQDVFGSASGATIFSGGFELAGRVRRHQRHDALERRHRYGVLRRRGERRERERHRGHVRHGERSHCQQRRHRGGVLRRHGKCHGRQQWRHRRGG
jgi:autotransporter passenger strand-loop-strand repeat protein